MKKIFQLLFALTLLPLTAQAQGWPSDYKGVMLQGFSWDSYVDTQWQNLESQADELSAYFSLIWVPQSGYCNTSSNVMGYTPVYYFNQNSSFGTEAQLRSMISTYKAKGTGIIADVVINHRNNLGVNSSWVDYPAEEYNGTTYQMTSTDICSDDDGGATKQWADANGYTLGNADEGEDWSGCRDLDHQSSNVQTIIKAYENYLLNDLGYTGFRYDMVKGFDASHIADYNSTCGVEYSVGEYWDSNTAIKNWIDNTNKQSAAFDFQFRYAVRDAINNSDWSKLGNSYLANDSYESGAYKQYAVTFVENHDMQDRGTTSGYTPDPITKDTLAANAFLLAMPGTPCVFLTHWKAYKQDIKAMINARKAAGISNTSKQTNMRSSETIYAVKTEGDTAPMIAVVGTNNSSYTPSSATYVHILSGYHYDYYLGKSAETVWVDKASGTYSEAFDVTLQAVTNDADAKIVYTLDGTDPTASSSVATDGQTLNISSDCTLKVGLLSNGSVKSIITRTYVIKPFEPHTATVYLKDPSWDNLYFYAWANDGQATQLLGTWPGTLMTSSDTKEIDGATWYYHTFDVNTADYSFNIIFDQGSGQDQTIDIGPINADTYYEIDSKVNGKYTVKDVTSTITGIENVKVSTTNNSDNQWYTLQGMRINKPQQRGIYIHNGKKIVVR